MLVDWVPTTENFGLQVFNDGFSAPTGPVPGTSACVKLGAASVTDLGITVDTHHAYEVRFAISDAECVVPADRWYWVTVHAVAPIPGFGSAFFATGGNGVVSGVVARKNDNFPNALWRSVEECCIGTTDLAFSVRSDQTQTFAADINCSGNLSVQDLFDFLAEYFAGSPNSDFNYSGHTSVQDIFDFLACYFGGCV